MNCIKDRILLVVLLVSLLGVYGCHSVSDESKEKVEDFTLTSEMLKSIDYQEVTMKSYKDEIELYGKIVTDFNKTIEIFPYLGGTVESVHAELGDFVQKGQLLAIIRSVDAAGIEKQLIDDENDLVVATRNLKTAKELYDGKLSAEKDVLMANNEYEKAKSELKRTKEIYKIYNLKSGARFEVRSPLTGFITQRNINVDMQLRSDNSNNIFDIAQIDDVWVLANVNEGDIERIRLGMSADITTLSYPSKVFYGKVDKLFNVLDPVTKAMKVRIKLKNENFLLKPEMLATVRLFYEEESLKCISVPSSAVIFDKDKYFVIVYMNGKKVELREVEPISQVDKVTFVKRGLNEGEKIITKNQLFVYRALTM